MAEGKYAQVNGLNLYYEIHGKGEPLVLLHGGYGAIEMFEDILNILSKYRQVIGVDLQAHGRTADIDRPFSFEAMADDVAGLIRQMEPALADVMGFSLGGGVALRLGIQHPELVRKLVLVSTPFKRSGWYPEMVQGMLRQTNPEMAEMMKQMPMYPQYVSLAPRPEDWTRLVMKIGELLSKDYDWTTEVKTIKVPTLLVLGDADGISPAHAVQFFELLGGGLRDANWDGSGKSISRLAILPGLTHYNIFTSPLLASTVETFLEAPLPEEKGS